MRIKTIWHRVRELERQMRFVLRELALEENEEDRVVSAKGELNMLSVKVGDKGIKFTFTEFDGPNGTGAIIKPTGKILFASDSPAATVDNATQVQNTDGSVTVDVQATAAGVAHITGVDVGDPNAIAAGDVLTVADVTPPPPPPPKAAVSATGVLSIVTPV